MNEAAAKRLTSPWKRLVPESVTTLRLPPAPPPNSGATLEAVTRNSATASWPTATRLEPVVSSRLSRPSMERLLLRAQAGEGESAIGCGAAHAGLSSQRVGTGCGSHPGREQNHTKVAAVLRRSLF